MAHYNTILYQLLSLIPRHQFEARVREHQGDRYVKKFTTWNQLSVLLYAQASGKTSLRDIQHGLSSQAHHLYHLGLPDSIAKSTMADANAHRDYRIYQDMFHRLLKRCQSLSPQHKFHFKNPLISIDSTVIELGVTLFPWSRYAKVQGALKLHYGYDHAGDFPNFLAVTSRKKADNVLARQRFPIIPDSINCFDRGYFDGRWFRKIHDGKAFFVTRAKTTLVRRILEERPVPKGSGVLFDHVIEFLSPPTAEKFPYRMRLIHYRDPETRRRFKFLTNNLELPALTIAGIYKARWQIEAFFKWIKQNLKIKTFLGTSKNAVLTQIWVAMCYYLLLAYIKFQTRYAYSLFYLHRIIRATILERLAIVDLLRLQERGLPRIRDHDPQLAFSF